jgi:general secretion pathway protein I
MNSRGFSLLEVMLSLAIVAGLVVSTLGVVNHHLEVLRERRELAVASALAELKLWEMLREGVRKEGSFEPPHEGYRFEARLEPAVWEHLSFLTLEVRAPGGGRVALQGLLRAE